VKIRLAELQGRCLLNESALKARVDIFIDVLEFDHKVDLLLPKIMPAKIYGL